MSIRSLLAGHFQAEPDENGNVTPKTTTISTDSSGDVTITNKQTLDKNTIQQQQEQQSMPQAGPPVQIASINPNPVNYLPNMPPTAVAPQSQQAPMPQQQAAPAPRPVDPNVFNRMVQAESGGRQTGPNGQILTSPKGAVGIAQIMPATAQQPGYGVTPATPQELATPEGNRAFGQRYFEGMFNHFDKDPEKAAAAYNAGPGTIEKAMRQAQAQGGDWKDYVPQETKTYLTKVFPKGKEETEKKYAPLLAGMQGAITDTGHSPEESAIHHLVLNSRDPNALGMGAYAGEHLLDPATKKAYADQHATVLEQNRMEQKAEKKAQELIASGGAGLQRALKDPSEEGSYLKAYLFQRLGLTDLAKNEQQKLGAGDMWGQTMVDGKPAWVKYNGQGAPTKGYSATGELTPDQLINTQNMKGVTQHTQAYKDMDTGKMYHLQTTPMGPRYVSADGTTFSGDTGRLFAYGIGSDVAMQSELAFQKSGQGQRGKQAAETGTSQIPLPASGVNPMGSGQGPAPQPQGQGQAQMPAPAGGQYPQTRIDANGNVISVPAAPQQRPAGPAVPQQQAPAAVAAPVAPGDTQQRPGESYAAYQQRMALQKSQAEANIGVGAKEQESFIKYHAEDITPKADAGGQVSRIRREQINGPDGVLNNPEIAGILQGKGPASTEAANIIRDLVTGSYNNPNELSTRVRALDLSDRQKEVLYRQIGLQSQLAPLTLRANAGPGSISEGEHKLNRDAGVDITRQPLYSGLSLMTRSQFVNDQASARANFKAQHPELKTTDQFNAAWGAEKRRLDDQYDKIYAARAAYIAKYNKNGQNPGAVVDAYKHYPVPEWNGETQSWDVKGFSQKALRPSLSTFKE